MTTRTPVRDSEQKDDIIDHINQDHADDVLNIAHTYATPEARSANVSDIFQEGLLLETVTTAETREYFIPFELHDCDLGEQIHYIVFRAAIEQGKPLTGGKKQFFSVVSNEKITPHMQRLTLKSEVPLPENEPGFAWYFQLKAHTRRPESANNQLQPQEQAEQRQMMEAMRHVSSEERYKVLGAFFEGLRYYTLRQTAKSRPDAPFADLAIVDVFLHGHTNGSRWASSLQTGDIVQSNAEFHEHTAHLAEGRALLLADETALPTVAALLENWCNPQAPLVITLTDDPADQAYLPDELLPAGTIIHRLSSRHGINAVIDCLQTAGNIDAAWGALEAGDANTIRKHLRERGLAREHNRVKGYWRREQSEKS